MGSSGPVFEEGGQGMPPGNRPRDGGAGSGLLDAFAVQRQVEALAFVVFVDP